MTRLWLALSCALAAGLLASCTGPEPEPKPEPTASLHVPLDDARLLRRLSLDLRGVLPSLEELDQVEADPTALSTLRDQFLDDPRLEGRLVELYGEHMRTLLDVFQVRYYDYRLDATQECIFERSVGEEPLRLMAHVAVNDLPWSEVVTADYTFANETLLDIWPLESLEPEVESGWRMAAWTDGRPVGGVLASNGLWWRYVTSKSNANRSRVAAISSLLLCSDMLARPVSFSTSPSLADAEGTARALKETPECIACHASIEPLAASLFGFYPSIDYNPLELGYYHPEREATGYELLDVEPAYYGTPIGGLVDLGWMVAEDPRFYRCAAETMATLLWRREVQVSDFERIEALRDTFLEEGAAVRPLLAAITDDPVYRAGAMLDGSETEMTTRMVSPDLLRSALRETTGFVWKVNNCDQLQNDDYGYRVLVGGQDGFKVVRPQSDPGLTWALVLKRVAQGAAGDAVRRELVDGAERRLFLYVSLDTPSTDPLFEQELVDLHRRLFATRPSAERLAADTALWEALEAEYGAEVAWSGLVSSLLRDPAFVSY